MHARLAPQAGRQEVALWQGEVCTVEFGHVGLILL